MAGRSPPAHRGSREDRAMDRGNPGKAAQVLRICIMGRPVTKKNSRRHIWVHGKPVVLPSAAHERWFGPAKLQVQLAVSHALGAGVRLPFRRPVNVAAVFYRKALV